MAFTYLLLLCLVIIEAHASRIVIIGAGTSGCALAARLCERLPHRNITLLERARPRGKQARFLVFSPRQMWNAWNSPLVVETYPTLPNKGLFNRSLSVIAGNTLGGTSAVNAMQWVIPRVGSVESWNIPGLDTNSSRRFYRRAFRTVKFAAQTGNLRHIHVTPYLRAAKKAGYVSNIDPFDASSRRDMFENLLAVDEKGRRRDSCTAYLKPVRTTTCQKNLRLVQGATVTRILLSSGKRPRARGVEYLVTGTNLTKRIRVAANGEIIVSAGPFGSPKLLQLSGIGPRRVLRKAGIPLRVELPVGEKTQARNFVAIDSSIPGVRLEPSNNSTLLNSPRQRKKWEIGRGSPLGIASFFANGRDRGDAYLTGTGSFFPSSVDRKILSSSCNGNVKSRGFVRIRSNDPLEPLDVQYSLLSRKTDLRRVQRCLNRLKVIHEKMPSRFNASFTNPPGGLITEQWIRENAGWAGHFVGGCQVGAVLTGRLKVKGVDGLRVIDSSSLKSMPVSAGPMASTYMLAEFMAKILARVHL